jgi:transposase
LNADILPGQGSVSDPTSTKEDVVTNRKRAELTRGDRRRNERLSMLRAIVRPELAIVGVDLASAKQAAVVTDHESQVLAKRMFVGSAWVIDDVLAWAAPIASSAGFGGVVMACEPTGHRWKPLLERGRAHGVDLGCVNPMLVARAREAEDFTKNRADFSDAVLISRLASERRCFVPYLAEGLWARLRHLGVRRSQQLVAATAARQGLRDLLECYWPAILDAAEDPMDSCTLRAVLSVSTDPRVIAGMDLDSFAAAVRAELPQWGGVRRNHRVLAAAFEAARHPGGVRSEVPAAAERARFSLLDWQHALGALAEVEAALVEVMEELGLAELVTTIDGLSVVGAAAILAETGDPTRFDSPRAWVKHAGLAPRANESGTFFGQTKTSGRGRPRLRTATWRAIWPMIHHNTVFRARSEHLRSRADNPLKDGQVRTALGAALLRQLFVVVTRRVAWDPAIASGQEVVTIAA